MTRTRRLVQRGEGDGGAVAVEFALVAPLVIILVFAVVQLGLALNVRQGLQAAAREGARVASVQGASTADITTAVNTALTGVIGSADLPLTPSITSPCPPPSAGGTVTYVTVSVSSPYTIDIPLLNWFVPSFNPISEVTLTGTGAFRCE